MKFNLSKEIITKDIYNILHVIVLILSLFLVISISIDAFNNIPFQTASSYLKIQLWICIFFLFVFFLELLLAEKKWNYFGTHLIFFLISIPYLSIIEHYNIDLSDNVKYFTRFIPLLRGGYALAIVVGRFASSKVTSIFFSYVTMLLATVYFGSLLFFQVEHNTNPLVNTYGDALWWACMNVTTVGSDIYATTVAGRIITIVLAALGMMMFPIFTVYVTSLVQKVNKKNR